MNYPKRLIEVDLPIKRISAHARREKSIRHGHISTLHIWWARRPLAACRAVICASLWPDPVDVTASEVDTAKQDGKSLELNTCPGAFRDFARKEMLKWTTHERQRQLSPESRPRFERARKDPALFNDSVQIRGALLDFIADFANWDNSTVREYLDSSRALTQAAHEALGGSAGTRPLIIDPFAGGGSIPLEALRVGADAFASDLNPIPVLLNKVVLEYVPKYGQHLADEVKRLSVEILSKAKNELHAYHAVEQEGSEAIVYLWFKTILSEAPGADEAPIELPLIRSMWLSKSKGRELALRWVRDKQGNIATETKEITHANGKTLSVRQPLIEVFSPRSVTEVEPGTSKGGAATCPITDYTTPVESVRKQLSERAGGAADARLGCVVSVAESTSGRKYRIATSDDRRTARAAAIALDKLKSQSNDGITLVPEGKLNHLRGFFNVVLYGMTRWYEIFAPRQLLTLVTFSRLIREAGAELARDTDEAFAVAVQTCLAMALGRLADYGSSLCVWSSNGEFVCHTFGRQALPMVWDFAETNPLSGLGWAGACEWVVRVLEQNELAHLQSGTAIQASAMDHPLPSDAADATITDPPYYAAIPYADLSDFFYGWLQRTLWGHHKELFAAELAPKDDECVALSHRAAMYRHKDAAWFEQMMGRACSEGRRVTKPNGIGVYVFANKETHGWEAMLGALIDAGWTVTGSWPIDTERGGRLRAHNSAVLASSVHLVCRPRENREGSLLTGEVGDWRDVLAELPRRIHEWMPRLTEEGVVGADAIFACLGPALEIFSRYSRVEKASGEEVSLKDYLVHVWAIVSQEALSTIFEGATTEGFEPDARLTAMWLWTLNAPETDKQDGEEDRELEGDNEETPGSKKAKSGFLLEYDTARKIAQGLGAHLEDLSSLIEVSGDAARLLPVAERTHYLFGKEQGQAPVEKKKKKPQLDLFSELTKSEDVETTWGEKAVTKVGATTLDRIHQSMILFAAGRGEALRRFLVDDGGGKDQRFWSLANALAALYPRNTNERRWVEGVLARKRGLGL
jgi:putative DNA methylase